MPLLFKKKKYKIKINTLIHLQYKNVLWNLKIKYKKTNKLLNFIIKYKEKKVR
jgi:hypothetical protein